MLIESIGLLSPSVKTSEHVVAGSCTFATQESADWRGEGGGAENHRLKAMGEKQM